MQSLSLNLFHYDVTDASFWNQNLKNAWKGLFFYHFFAKIQKMIH